MIIVDLSG